MKRRWLSALVCLALFFLALPGLGEETLGELEKNNPALFPDVLRRLPFSWDGEVSGLAHQGSRVALLTEQYEKNLCTLTLFDLDGGQVLASTSWPTASKEEEDGYYSAWEPGFFENGEVWALNMGSLELSVFTRELEPVQRIEPPDPTVYYTAWPQSDGTALWVGGADDSLTRLDLKDGRQTIVKPELPDGWFFSHFQGEADSGVLCAYSNGQGLMLMVLMTQQGQAGMNPVRHGTQWMDGSACMLLAGSHALLGSLRDQGDYLRIGAWQADEHPAAVSGDFLLSSRLDNNAVMLKKYDLKQGLIAAQVSLELPDESGSIPGMTLLDSGDVLLKYQDYENGEQGLYLWAASENSGQLEAGVEIITLEDFARENTELAREIGAAYGLNVYIRGEGASFIDLVYQGEPQRDELRLRTSLDDLKRFLAILPPGMTREALVLPYTSLGVYLSGAIHQLHSGGIQSPAGFVSNFGNERYLAVNTQDSQVYQNLAHEFMHVLEDRLWLVSNQDGTALLDGWDRLGPEEDESHGFVYTYLSEDGYTFYDDTWTAAAYSGQGGMDRVWFIDAYSRTYPMEDRARVFEHLFLPSDHWLQPFRYPNLLLKARVLSALIREAFPSVREVENAFWEDALVKMDRTELETLLTPERETSPASQGVG